MCIPTHIIYVYLYLNLNHIVFDTGDFDHITTNKHTYKDMGPQEKSRTIKFASQLGRDKRSKFDGKTQNMRDFPGYRSQPLPEHPVTPPPTTIRLSMDSRYAQIKLKGPYSYSIILLSNCCPDRLNMSYFEVWKYFIV